MVDTQELPLRGTQRQHSLQCFSGLIMPSVCFCKHLSRIRSRQLPHAFLVTLWLIYASGY